MTEKAEAESGVNQEGSTARADANASDQIARDAQWIREAARFARDHGAYDNEVEALEEIAARIVLPPNVKTREEIERHVEAESKAASRALAEGAFQWEPPMPDASASNPTRSVWLIWTGEYEQRGILKAFALEADARRYIAHQAASPQPSSDYEVEELVLDDPNFPVGAWCCNLQEPPCIGGWAKSLYWHSGVDDNEPATYMQPILSPRDGGVIGGRQWKAYGKTPEIAHARAEAARVAMPTSDADDGAKGFLSEVPVVARELAVDPSWFIPKKDSAVISRIPPEEQQ